MAVNRQTYCFKQLHFNLPNLLLLLLRGRAMLYKNRLKHFYLLSIVPLIWIIRGIFLMSYTAFTSMKIHRKVDFFPTQTFVTAKCADRELNCCFRNHSTVLFLCMSWVPTFLWLNNTLQKFYERASIALLPIDEMRWWSEGWIRCLKKKR